MNHTILRRGRHTARGLALATLALLVLGAGVFPAAAGGGDTAFLGISSRGLRGEEARDLRLDSRDGAILQTVYQGTAAEAAGLRRNDVIVEFGGRKVYDDSDLTDLILDRDPGDTVTIGILRDGKPMTVEATLGSRQDWDHEQGHDRPGWVQALENLFGGTEQRGPHLGVETMGLNRQMRESFEVDGGVMITRVTRNSAAEEAGLRAGDIVVRVAGERVTEEGDIRDALSGRFGETIGVEFVRQGKRMDAKVTLDQE